MTHLECGHEAIFERSDAGRKFCIRCFGIAKQPPDRARYHRMLDQAMDATVEGESFLSKFTGMVIAESRPRRSCNDHSNCDKAMDEEMKRGGTFLHHPEKVGP